MFGLGVTELVIILVIVMVFFGVGKLPEIGKGLGKGIKEFKDASSKPDEIEVTAKSEKTEPVEDKKAEDPA